MSNIKKSEKLKSVANKLWQSNVPYYLIPLTVLGAWLAASGVPFAAGYYLIHYVYTYDHGFIPRGLLGEIISWFTDTVSKEMIGGITTVFSALLVVSVSLCIGKALSKLKRKSTEFNMVLVMIVILCIIPTSFSMHFQAIHLDKILWFLTFFAVYISDNKYGIWFIPAICVISVLINPVYVFGSMIFIAIVLLQKFHSNNYSAKNGIICAVSYIGIILIALYGPISEAKIGFNTPAEMVDYYFSRYAEPLSETTYYGFVNEWLFDYFEPIDRVFEMTYELYFKGWEFGQLSFFYLLMVVVPVCTVVSAIWLKSIRNESNKFQKFIYILCMISPLVIIPEELLGWELPRYYSDILIVQICLLIYFVVNKHSSVISAINSLISFCKEHMIISVMALLHFVFIIVL